MCGIAGELRWDGAGPEAAALDRMLQALAQRGPDGEGQWRQGQVALGHRRLAIIDLSERSRQPMRDERLDLTLVFNGTLYNYPSLRAQLQARGHVFVSGGDTEVLLRAYAEWGESCVEHFHGMFAFALWDGRRQCLFLARDRLGIKPLYFCHGAGGFRFASTLPALLRAGGVDTTLDPVALHYQFTLHASVPAPWTVLRGVRKLEQGTTLTLAQDGATQSRRYWHLRAEREDVVCSEAEWTERIHSQLRAAVRKRREIADVPVGVLLSGGLDSSLLVALLAEEGGPDLETFSIGFEDHPEESGNEFQFSDRVAQLFGTRHHQFRVPNHEVLCRLPEAVAAMSEPMVSQDVVSFYLLAEQVSRSVKVVQSGQGADEVFAGYSWHQKMAADTSGTPVERLRRYYFDREHEEMAELFEPAYRAADVSSALLAVRLSEPCADGFMDQVLRAETTLLITDDPVKRLDNMTMSWGLEARVPFLDHELVELAARMPPELKLASGGKHILKKVARSLLPADLIDRPKGYFPMPALKYVRGEFLEFMRDLLHSDACRRRGVYRRAYVDRLLAEPEAHRTRIDGSTLWHLALLELWLQQTVDPAGFAAHPG